MVKNELVGAKIFNNTFSMNINREFNFFLTSGKKKG
jgi:hypothetical protein